MPKIVLTVPETNESVTRPVVFSVTRQLLELTGLSTDTNILYPGDLEKAKQPGSELTQTAGINTMPFTNRIFVEVDENFETDRILSTAIYRPENLFVFRDDRIETSIKPVYSSADITINFKYRAVDKTSAMRWRDDIRTRVSMMEGMRVELHTLPYHYLIPPEFLVILKELHRMRESIAGYDEAYEQYFQNNLTKNASVFTTLAGTQGAWGVSEKQIRVVGYFDFEGAPEQGSKEDDGDTWTISFAYKFKYDKPIACIMMYPLMIHNQLVSSKFRPSLPVDDPDKHSRDFSLSASNFAAFESGRNLPNQMPGVSIPSFDEFIPSSVPFSTMRVFTALTNIDTSNPRFLLSLKDLGKDNIIHPAILKFMVGEVPYMFKFGLSIFLINIYRGIYIVNDILDIDTDLKITSKIDLPLRQYYHIRLSLITDLTLLSKEALIRLRNNGEALNIILNYLDPSLNGKGLLPNIMVGDYVSKSDLNAAIDEMNKATMSQGNWQITNFNTVQTMFISAHKEKDYASDYR